MLLKINISNQQTFGFNWKTIRECSLCHYWSRAYVSALSVADVKHTDLLVWNW